MKRYIPIVLLAAVFAAAWYLLAANLTPWSDETTHLAVGKCLLEDGTYRCWDFDAGKVLRGFYKDDLYIRAKIVSYLTKIAYQAFGVSALAAKTVPLACTMLLFAVYAVYMRKRHNATPGHLSIAAVFFFAQSLVLEQSMYVRVYAPLALLQLIGLIAYWEGSNSFFEKKVFRASALWAVSLVTLAIPTIDTWQYLQLPIFALAVLLDVAGRSKGFMERLERNRPRLVRLAIACIILAPCVTITLAALISRFPAGNRVLGFTFFTYWDNIAGLARYLWAINICCIGLAGRSAPERSSGLVFGRWLFLTGILSGLLLGLYEPHNCIFYSRFFYASTVFTVLGFAGLIGTLVPDARARNRLIAVYVIANLLLSSAVFYYDRSNIKAPITWLRQHLKSDDVLIVFTSYLGLNGGEMLAERAYEISPSRDFNDVRKLMDRIKASPGENVYFLYTDHYENRNVLYAWTTGQDRNPPSDLFRYLKSGLAGEKVMAGLRGCGLIRYDKTALLAALQGLLVKGYPPEYKSIELKLLRKIKEAIAR